MIDLPDASFLIPIRIDSIRRAKNINYVIEFILSEFNVPIFLYEDDDQSRVEKHLNKNLLDKCCYCFFENKEANRTFHKAKLFNRMAIDSQSSILIFQDSDCFLDSLGLYADAIKMIQDGESDLVYPHNKCPRYEVISDNFFDSGDRSYLKFFRQTNNNVGGLSMMSADAFSKIGMWNEHFESWGKEDDDFCNRSNKMGLRINRLNGSLIHLNHDQDIGSGFYSKRSESSDKEIGRIWNMTKEELYDEVPNWSWVVEFNKVRKTSRKGNDNV